MPINTQALRDIFNDVDFTTDEMKNISDEELWKIYFKIDKAPIGRVFNNLIHTNFKSVSVNYIKADQYEQKRTSARAIAKIASETKKSLVGKTNEEINKIKEDKKEKQKEKNKQNAKRKKEIQKKKKEEFEKMSKEDQQKRKLKDENKEE